MEEKRMGHRWRVGEALSCSLLDSLDIKGARILDLSLKGVKVSSLSSVLIGKEVKLFITMPNGNEAINALGEVVWNGRVENNSYCGIKFTRIKDKDRVKISSFIHEHFGEELKRKIWWEGIN